MKYISTILLITAIALAPLTAKGQTYTVENFDGASLPSGWTFDSDYSISAGAGYGGSGHALAVGSTGLDDAVFNTNDSHSGDQEVSALIYTGTSTSQKHFYIHARKQASNKFLSLGLQLGTSAGYPGLQFFYSNTTLTAFANKTGHAAALFDWSAWYKLKVITRGKLLIARAQRMSDSKWLTSGGAWTSNSEVDCLALFDQVSSITSVGKAGFLAYQATSGGLFDNFSFLDDAGVSSTAYALLCDGDSLTAGTSLDQKAGTWPAHVAGSLNTQLCLNYAVAGNTIQQRIDAASSGIDTADTSGYSNTWIVLLAGINDAYYGASGATMASRAASYVSGRKSGHPSARIAICTVAAAGTVTGSAETARQDYNTSLRANFAGADALIDLDSYTPDSGTTYPFRNPANTTYFLGDAVHWTPTLQKIAANLIYTGTGGASNGSFFFGAD